VLDSATALRQIELELSHFVGSRTALLSRNESVWITGVCAESPAELVLEFEIAPTASGPFGAFTYRQPDLDGLLAEVREGLQASDAAATVIVANLGELLAADDMGLERALRSGIVRTTTAPAG
jgi:hypothetical protein